MHLVKEAGFEQAIYHPSYYEYVFLREVCMKHFLFIPTLLYVMKITYEEVGKNH